MADKYPHHQIETKWQKYWEENKTFKTPDQSEKPKYYILDMFPYPSGAGLHMGHPEGYTATDILARYKRMCGFNVLHPMGWDAFGLPAEQYAIETGVHPAKKTAENIANFRRQIKSLGFSYDWDREINTTDEKYYKWTQWIFLKLYEKGLAYEAEVPVNWCPALGTVLANEEVIDGKSERGGHPVIRKPMRQWMLKITAYADRLLDDLDDLDWPDSIKEMQRNWIGRSSGARVHFKVPAIGETLTVFTTRPDTLWGATYMVVSPEHPLVDRLTIPEQRSSVEAYQEQARQKSELDRTDLAKDKTGVFSGSYAINPVNNSEIPIWIADYVLVTYGTGAIMAVPGHDDRDYEFAKKYDLPIVEVVAGGDLAVEAYTDNQNGKMINSTTPDGSFSIDGLNPSDAIGRTIEWLEKNRLGEKTIQYRLRDWLFSRQRYWGEPIPVLHKHDKSTIPLSDNDLPLTLPVLNEIKPTGTGESPLANAKDWMRVVDSNTGEVYRRESNTMPQWAGSCWYYLRYLDPNNDLAAWSTEKEKYWMPVDLYIGGAEHAVLHLLYARFWHKVLFDLGYVSTKEPFKKLINQGIILGEDGEKMSKSRGNVSNPDDVVAEYGADSLRLYEMFLGPLERSKPWNQNGIEGVFRFLNRVWRHFVTLDGHLQHLDDSEPTKSTLRELNYTIKKVTEDLDNYSFNTAISQLMIMNNHFREIGTVSKNVFKIFILLLSPLAPHLAEEFWSMLKPDSTLAYEPWPTYDKAYIQKDNFEMVIQINGKVRDKILVHAGLSKDDLLEIVKSRDKVKTYLAGHSILKEIFIPQKLINLVLK